MTLRITIILVLMAGIAVLMPNFVQQNTAHADPENIKIDTISDTLTDTMPSAELNEPENNAAFEVQAVLSAQRSAVISGATDGILKKIPFNNGDTFKKGDVLAEYDCRFERAKYQESRAQLKTASRQADAYKRLKESEAVADVEYVAVLQDFEKAKAVLEQTNARLALCYIRAPFDGRITDKIANPHEAVRSGRVLMEISSNEPLQAELLVPSIWLRWINIGTDLTISVHETGASYDATIKRIHGKVDPVTQTAYVVAEISKYEEELLPGMSGRATFSASSESESVGFLGIKIAVDE